MTGVAPLTGIPLPLLSQGVVKYYVYCGGAGIGRFQLVEIYDT